MSTAEMKWEIVRTLDHLPDEVLAKALELLKDLDNGQRLNNDAHLDRHFNRFDQVLKKLAE